MTFAYNSYTATGSAQTISIPFPYLDKSHVFVAVNKVLYAAGTPTWNFVTATSITVTGTAGQLIEVFRNSSQSARVVDYMDGSSLTEPVLDQDSLQAFYMAQEALDGISNENIRLAAVESGVVATYPVDIGALQVRVTALEAKGVGTGVTPMAFNDITAPYTIQATDAYLTIRHTNAAAQTITVPADASVPFPIGTMIHVAQQGAGQTSVIGAGGVTINTSLFLRLRTRYSVGTLIKMGVNLWQWYGDLALT